MISASRFLIAALFCAFLFGCGDKKVEDQTQLKIPADSLIAEDKMVLILADVHVIEADLLQERSKGIDTKGKQGFYYQGLFKKFRISNSRYEQNLSFYRQNPENFSKMYERVVTLLEDRQKSITGQK